jgi:hypothetical protein
MMLTIAILSGIGYILSILRYVLKENRLDVDLIMATILVLSTWSVLPLAISILVISIVIAILNIALYANK